MDPSPEIERAATTWQSDQRAFARLVVDHYPSVYALAFSAVGDWAAAEDLAQEAFLQAWARKHTLRTAAAFSAWVRQIVRNLARNWHRSADVRRRLFERYRQLQKTGDASGTGPEQKMAGEARRAEAWDALAVLNPHVREAVVIYYFEDCSVDDVARALGVTSNAVKKRLQRGRGQLRGYFEQKWRAELTRARGTIPPESIRDRFLAGVALGPALPKLGNAVAGTGLGLWWEAFKASALVKPTLLGGTIVSTKSAVGIATLALIALAGAFWAVTHGSEGDATAMRTPSAAQARDLAARTAPPVGPGSRDTAANEAPASDEGEPASPDASPAAPVLGAPVGGALGTDGPRHGGTPDSQLEPKRIDGPEQHASVVGEVMDGAHRPLPEARVTLIATGLDLGVAATAPTRRLALRNVYERTLTAAEHRWSTLTDASGQFAIEGISFAGQAVVLAHAPGFAGSPKAITLEPGGETVRVRLVLEEGIPLLGRVLSPRGQPVADGLLRLALFFDGRGGGSGTGGLTSSAFADADGHFEMVFKEPGTATLRCSSHIYGEAVFEGLAVEPDAFVELRYPDLAALFGRIQQTDGAPASGCSVWLEGGIEGWQANEQGNVGGGAGVSGATHRAQVDEQGMYRIDGVDAGQRYSVTVADRDGVVCVSRMALDPFQPGEAREWNYTVEQVTLVFGVVWGTTHGAPVPGVRVVGRRIDTAAADAGAHTTTGPDGAFELSLQSGAGTYQFTVKYTRIGADYEGPEMAYAREARVGPGQSARVDLRVPEPVSASYRVVTAAGHPVVGATVHVDETTGNTSIGYELANRTDEDGGVSLPVLPPHVEVRVSFRHEGLLPGRARPILANPGDALPTETVVLYEPASVTGVLVDGEGNLLAGSRGRLVAVTGDGNEVREAFRCDDDGVFRLEDAVPAADVALSFFVRDPAAGGGRLSALREVRLAPGDVSALGTIALHPTAAP